MKNKLLIIDGHSFVFRAYYAFQTAGLKNSITGEPSGAVFGFFRMLFKLIQDYSPTHIAIPFDPGTPLERNKIFENYKATRKPMPEDLKPQIKKVQEICSKLGFPVLRIDGQEADDIIATLCKHFGNKENEVLLFSGDKDMYQLLNRHVRMLRGKKGVSEFVEIDPDWVKKEIGVEPSQITDYMAIVGDISDNIPGVKGIGEKGASKLIAEFHTLDGIYKHLNEIKNPSIKAKLEADKENAYLSKQLATVNASLDLNLDLKALQIPDIYQKEKILIFKREGFNQIYKDMAKQSGQTFAEEETSPIGDSDSVEIKKGNSEKGEYRRIQTLEELKEIVQKVSKAKFLCVDTETTSKEPMRAELVGISFTDEAKRAWYVPVAYNASLFASQGLPKEEVLKIFKPVLENEEIRKIGQNIKYDAIVLKNCGIDLKNIFFDTMIASYIVNPGARRHNMDDMAEDLLDYKTITFDELVGTGKKRQEIFNIDVDRVSEYSCEDADITYRLYEVLENKVKEIDSSKVFHDIEMPLVNVLLEMEMTGVAIDTDYFLKLSKQFEAKLEKLEKSIHVHAGRDFNIASTKELQEILFSELKLPSEKKIQTGFSTDHSVLESLSGMHPIIDDLLEHRKYSKLKSTYIDTLPKLVNPVTRRIHTSYNQTIAATGRLSSTDPNLQNIPIRDEEGRMIRRGFIPESKKYSLLSLDYSQIELRIMAHFSKDKKMIDAYERGLDIHRRTASALFGVEENSVTPEMRDHAKVVNFSVIYGVTPYGLSQNLKIPRKEATEFIEKYFEQYPGVKKFMEEICASCEKHGYVETITGRRRYLPDINSPRKQEVEAAKRIAINSPIQGTSADMIKIAMIRIHNELIRKKMNSKMIMQVHDELVFEVFNDEKEKLLKLAKSEMENAIELRVPILVEGKFGSNWDEAH